MRRFVMAVSLAIMVAGCASTPKSTQEPVSVEADLVYRLDQVDMRPDGMWCADPNPTGSATRPAGTVTMRFVLGIDGHPEPNGVVFERGYDGTEKWRGLTDRARRRLLGCEWETPAVKGGEPVRVQMRFTAVLEQRL